MGRHTTFWISYLLMALCGSVSLAVSAEELFSVIKCGSFEDLQHMFESKKQKTAPLNERTDPNMKNKAGMTPLLFSAQENRSDMALYLFLKQKGNIEAVDQDGRNILHIAAKKGSLGVIQILSGNFGDHPEVWKRLINAKDSLGFTPLHWAAQRGNRKVLIVLLQHGANSRALDDHGKSPLYWAVKKGQEKIAKILLAVKSVDINDTDLWGMTALHVAARSGQLDIAQDLVKAGAQVNAQDIDGKTPLYWASARNHLDVVQYLLSKKADAKIKDADKRTPLHVAARYGYTGVVKFLVQKAKLNVNAEDPLKETPVCWAVRNGYVGTVQALIAFGADLKYLSKGGVHIFHAVAAKGDADMIKLLAKKGYNVNVEDADGKTALHKAAESGASDTVSVLMDQGADANKVDKSGKTPLHYAAAAGKVDVTEILMGDGGAKASSKAGKDGKNAIQQAAQNKQIETVENLLYLGNLNKESLKKISEASEIKFFMKDKSGKTVFDYALEKGHIKLLSLIIDQEDADKALEILKKSKGDLNALDQDTGLSLMHYGALTENQELVEKLLRTGASVDVEKGNSGMTPLHYAVLGKSAPLVKIFMKNDADATHTDKNGKSPFMDAINKGFGEGVNIFLHHKVSPRDYVGDKRPMDVVMEDQNTQMVELFMNYFKGNSKMLDRFDKVSVVQDMKDENGMTVVHWAAKEGHSSFIDTLFDISKMAIRANISGIDTSGRTPLHYAAAGGYPDIIEKLLGKKEGSLNVNTLTDEGRLSALHEAAKNNQIPTVRKLIDLGADRALLDKDKKKALDYLGAEGEKIEKELTEAKK